MKYLLAALSVFSIGCATDVGGPSQPAMFREPFERSNARESLAARPASTTTLPRRAALSPATRAARFRQQLTVYTVNSTAGTINAFDADSTGALSGGHSIAVGTTPYGIALNQTASVAYVANAGSGDIQTLLVEPNGSLSPVASVPFVGAASVTIHNSGKWLFATAFAPGNRVEMFSINAMDGTITSTGSSIAATTSPFDSALNPTGSHLFFATARLPFRVHTAQVDSLGGALIEGSSIATGTTPRSVVVHPAGLHVIATNIGGHQIVPHAFNQVLNELTPLTPIEISAPRSVVFDATGQYMYVTSYTIPSLAGSIVQYKFDVATGTASVVNTVSSGGLQPFAIRFSPDFRFLYAVNVASDNLVAFQVDASSGHLSEIGSVSTDAGPVSLAVASRSVEIL